MNYTKPGKWLSGSKPVAKLLLYSRFFLENGLAQPHLCTVVFVALFNPLTLNRYLSKSCEKMASCSTLHKEPTPS